VHGDFSEFLAALQGARVVNLTSTEPTLESVFLTYYRDPPAAAAVTTADSAG
jgi:hypothetical protein